MPERLDTTPQLSLIMDAIADNSLTSGTMAISFANKFPTYEWLDDIRNKLKLKWAKWLPEQGEVVIVGGSAALAKPLVEQTTGRFKIYKETPQFCNIVKHRSKFSKSKHTGPYRIAHCSRPKFAPVEL